MISLQFKGLSRVFSNTTVKSINSSVLSFLYSPTLTSVHDYWKNQGKLEVNQGKLEVVKQEMVRVNIDILGINGLKWTGMGKINSDDHFTYYCGQESLRKNWVALIVDKRVQNAVLGSNLKNDVMISVHFQGKPFSITVIKVYAPTSNAAAATAKSLQSCPTLCSPTDDSPPGSPVPGILQARTLEWVAISFSNA